jgi:hypothetical protein
MSLIRHTVAGAVNFDKLISVWICMCTCVYVGHNTDCLSHWNESWGDIVKHSKTYVHIHGKKPLHIPFTNLGNTEFLKHAA